MTANVQGSASSIGMAPSSAARPPVHYHRLPLEHRQQRLAPEPQRRIRRPQPQQQGSLAQQRRVAGFDINSLASKGRWMGPVMAIGGGVAALMAFSKGKDGSKFLKYGGISGALSGLMLTGVGFKAKGIETGTKNTEALAVQAINQLLAAV